MVKLKLGLISSLPRFILLVMEREQACIILEMGQAVLTAAEGANTRKHMACIWSVLLKVYKNLPVLFNKTLP
jgi:hypothetical protein